MTEKCSQLGSRGERRHQRYLCCVCWGWSLFLPSRLCPGIIPLMALQDFGRRNEFHFSFSQIRFNCPASLWRGKDIHFLTDRSKVYLLLAAPSPQDRIQRPARDLGHLPSPPQWERQADLPPAEGEIEISGRSDHQLYRSQQMSAGLWRSPQVSCVICFKEIYNSERGKNSRNASECQFTTKPVSVFTQ